MADYTVTIPAEIASVFTKTSEVGSTVTYTLAETAASEANSIAYVGTWSVGIKIMHDSHTVGTTSYNVKITDACETATVTLPTQDDITWQMASADSKTEIARFETVPTACKARMLYTWTVPAAILSKVATTTDGSADSKIELSLSGESADEGVVAEHTVSLQVKGPAGTDIANGAVSFKVTVGAKATTETETETETTGTGTGGPQAPIQKQGSAIQSVKNLQQIIQVGAGASQAVKVAIKGQTAPKTGRLDGSRPGTGTGSKQGQGGSVSLDGDATTAGTSTEGDLVPDGETNFDVDAETSTEDDGFSGVDFSL